MVLHPSCSPRIPLREETAFAESLLNAWGGRSGRVTRQREGDKITLQETSGSAVGAGVGWGGGTEGEEMRETGHF